MRYLFCVLVCFGNGALPLGAQSVGVDTVRGPGYEQYLTDPLPAPSADGWADLTDGIEYDDTLRERNPTEEETPQATPTRNPSASRGATEAFKLLLLLVAVGLLVFAIVQWRGGNHFFKTNRRIKRRGADVSLREIEENLDSVDLRTPLERAIADGNFRRAVRLLYLQSIQRLDEKRLVRWQIDKTNGEYLRELAAGELRTRFAEVTLVFERLWYGERDLDRAQFTAVHREFNELLLRIEQHAVSPKSTAL